MQWLRAAIANNVEWCDIVCQTHGVPTTIRNGVWLAMERPPELYPDAITTEPGTTAVMVAGLLGGRSGGAVKDSWADVDLSREGFAELFSARWISHDPVGRASLDLQWSALDSVEEFEEWASAAALPRLLGPGLLTEPKIRILMARQEGGIAGGAIMNRSSSVVGVSNVFSRSDAERAAVWSDLPAVAAGFFPGHPLVGYEHGEDLEDALAAGFVDIGSLRIWVQQGGGTVPKG